VTIWVIRHAQSLSNAGQATIGPHDNGLSELGYQQAKCVAAVVEHSPEQIIISPYLRTQLTAQPLIEKFPHVAVETWQVQEFTFLNLPLDQPTTPIQRSPLTQAYWDRCDPTYIDGERAESFEQLMTRAQQTRERLQHFSGFVVMVTHEQFIKAMLWQVLATPSVIDARSMRKFCGFWQSFRIPNASILKLEFQNKHICWSSFGVAHLSQHLQTSVSGDTNLNDECDR
jgi:broad specificity phosphatase PhoE